MMNLGACSCLRKTEPVVVDKGVDICKVDLKPFKLNESEFAILEKENKINAVKLNCILYTRCGVPIQNGYKCYKK